MKCKYLNLKGATLVIILSAVIFLSLSNFSYAYKDEINNITAKMIAKIGKSGKKTVAVVDFVDLQGNITELGRFLAEEFSVAFAESSEGFEVIDRVHLKAILKEHKLVSKGLIDPDSAKELKKIIGVDALITGSITPFGDSVRLAVKILDTETAKVISASSGDIAKTKAIEELLTKNIETAEPLTQTQPTAIPNPMPSSTSIVISVSKNIDIAKPLEEAAAALSKQASKGLGISEIKAGNSLIEDYNLLVKKCSSIFKGDLFIKALKTINNMNNGEVSAEKIAILAKELDVYLTSFSAKDAIKEGASQLYKKSHKGLGISEIIAGNSLIEIYNLQVQEAKSTFNSNQFIQALEEVPDMNNGEVAAEKISRLAKELETIMESL